MGKWYSLGVVLLVAVLAFAVRDYRHQVAAEKARVLNLVDVVQAQAEDLKQARAAVSTMTDLQSQVQALATETRALQTTLSKQSAQRRAEFLELLKNDQATRDWLALSVPVAVGVRYARPGTDDPAAWRDPAQLSAGGLPATGPPGGGQ